MHPNPRFNLLLIAKILLPSYRGRLTEGITYNPANNTLLWVDIIGAEVHRISLDKNADPVLSHEVLHFNEDGESIGAICLTKDNNKILICSKYGVCIGDFDTHKINYLVKYPHSKEQARRLRSNDGIIDPWGNLWIGVMTDFPVTKAEGSVAREGMLYRVDCTDLSVKVMEKDTFISNGLAFNNDGTKFYWTDLLTFTVWQFDYNVHTNTLSNKQPLIDMKQVFPDEASPEPDGLSLANDGTFFHAVFSTSTVVEYNEAGEVLGKIKIPAQRVTCTALGGPDDDTLFVTSAHEHLADSEYNFDANDKLGDLGGFLFQVKLGRKVHSKTKNLWGGVVV